MGAGLGLVGALASPVVAAWRLPLRTLRDRGLPSWFVPGIVSAVLFAKTGLDPHDVVRWSETSAATRCALWAGWLSLTRPAAAQLLSPPGSTWVRSAPISAIHPMAASGAAMAVLHAPFAVLFAVGGRPLGALATLVVAVLASLPMRGRAGAGSALGLALALGGAPSAVTLPLGVVGLAFALPAAWRRAAEPPSRVGLPALRLPPLAAWAVACTVHTLRVDRGRLLRLVGVLTLSALLFGLWSRNDPAASSVVERTRNATFVTVASVVASGTLLPAVARFRDQAQWLAASTGWPGLRRAAVLPLAVLPALLALAIAREGLLAALLGAAAAVLWVCAWESRDDGRSVVRALLVAAPLGVALALSGGALLWVAAALAAAGAGAFAWRSR